MDGAVKDFSALERATGKLTLGVKRRGDVSALDTFFQEGCLKARFPKMHSIGAKRAVLINTTGGIADGDRLATTLDVGDNADLAVTTQAAERIYRARVIGNPALIDTKLNVGTRGRLMWLPQETILFNKSAVRRRFDVNIAPGGSFLGVEMLVLGRTAMQEQVTNCNLFDRWRIRVGDDLVFADGQKLSGDLDGCARGAALLGQSIAYATLFFVGDKAADLKKPLRDIFESNATIAAGCSSRGPLLLARLAAQDSATLRHVLAGALTAADKHMNQSTRVTQAILPRWIY